MAMIPLLSPGPLPCISRPPTPARVDAFSVLAGNIHKELSSKEIIDLIDQAYELGVRIITLSGGEPLLKKDIIKIMHYAKKRGMITNVTHNGTLINENNVKEIASAFDLISILLRSLDERKHEKITGSKRNFKKLINAIRLMQKYAKHTYLGLQSVLTSENLDDLIQINEYFSGMGISTFFQPVHDCTENYFIAQNKKYSKIANPVLKGKFKLLTRNYRYTNPMIKFIYQKYHDLALDFLLDANSTRREFQCFAASLGFFIDPYGEVFPCDPLKNEHGKYSRKVFERNLAG